MALTPELTQQLIGYLASGLDWTAAKAALAAAVPGSAVPAAGMQTPCEQAARQYNLEHIKGSVERLAAYDLAQTPAAASSYPASGAARGGTLLTITGTGLGRVNSVTVGGHTCTKVVASPTQVQCRTPAHAVEAALHIIVSDGTLTSELTDAYAYVANATPAIAAWQPKTAQAKGGTRVIISGTGFADVTTVTLGGHACTIKEKTATRLVVETPAHAVSAALDLVVSDGTLSDTESAAIAIVASTTPLLV